MEFRKFRVTLDVTVVDPERVISLARAKAAEDGIADDDPLLAFSDLGDAVQWLLDPGSTPFDFALEIDESSCEEVRP